MANQIDAIKDIDKALESLIKSLKEIDNEVVDLSKSTREATTEFGKIKIPKDVDDKLKEIAKSTELVSDKVKERERVEKSLINTIAKKEIALESSNRALIKERFELQQQNKLIKEATTISSKYSTLLQKTTAQRNKLARTIQGLNLKRELGIKLSNKEQKELKQSSKDFKQYDDAIKKAKNSVNRFQENVGNYPKVLGSVRTAMTGLIGAFGVIEGLRLGVDFAQDAVRLAREAKGVQFAFKRLGIEGVDAFESIKAATKGTLSDLEIKKSLNEFNNLGIGLETAGVAFEFLAVRAAQTGRSVASMREDLVTGLGRGSVKVLDNLGLSMAELNVLTKEQGLSIQEAFGVIASKEIKKAGNILDEATSSQEKFNAAFENFKISAGSGFLGSLTNGVYEFGAALISVTADSNEASKSTSEFFSNLYGSLLFGQSQQVRVQADINREEKKRIPIIEEIIKLQKDVFTIDALNNSNKNKLLDLSTKELKILLASLKVKDKDVKNNEVIKETVADLRKKIKVLNDERETLTENDKERGKSSKKEIENIQKQINAILGLGKAIEKAKEKVKSIDLNGVGVDLEIPELTLSLDLDISEEGFQLATDKYDKLVKEVNKGLLKEAIGDLGGTIDEFTGVSGDKFIDFFDKITEGGIDSFEEVGDIAAAAFSIAGDVSNSFFQGRIDGYQADIEANNEYYASLLENENLSDSQRKRLEKDRAKEEERLKKKQNKEKEKQFLLNKAFSLGEIAVNTAVAVSKVLGQTGIFGLAASVPVIALGAIQAAIVLAQPVPKFAEGGVMGHDGAMMINDHSSGRLEVVERDGQLLMTDKKNAIVEGKKGDVIHKDANKYFADLSDDDISKNLKEHSILATLSHQNYISNKLTNKLLTDNQTAQTNRIVKAITSQKTKFNVQNNVSLSQDLKYLSSYNDTL